MLALSTSWNQGSCRSAENTIEQIKGLGFECVELCFSHTQKDLKEILKSRIKVTSLHNFCPIPDGLPRKKALPDCFSLASTNTEERKKAVKLTKRTILSARKFKAKAVVLHTGRVEIPDYTKQLIKILSRKKETRPDKFASLRELEIQERKNNKVEFLDNIFLSIKELADFAFNEGVLLGIENRIYIREIPNFQEIKIFTDNFHKKGVGYWHDTGHAYILEKLGFAKHTDYLKTYSRYLLGIHIHDVKGFVDHNAPFSGEIDFTEFRPYIKKDTIKVVEAHKPASAKELIQARKKLEKLYN
ncbi:MAG: TIM barrel protein [Candidatus Omnitrophica bacterium]|nr:TIM barrel protein [Candidatus Omnitrophota bacterium]